MQDLLCPPIMSLAVSAIRTKVRTAIVTAAVAVSREETLVLFVCQIALIVIAISA
jgi:hypothetical protein